MAGAMIDDPPQTKGKQKLGTKGKKEKGKKRVSEENEVRAKRSLSLSLRRRNQA